MRDNLVSLNDQVESNRIDGYYLHHISLDGAIPNTSWDGAYVTSVDTIIYTKDTIDFAKTVYCGSAQSYELHFGFWYARE